VSLVREQEKIGPKKNILYLSKAVWCSNVFFQCRSRQKKKKSSIFLITLSYITDSDTVGRYFVLVVLTLVNYYKCLFQQMDLDKVFVMIVFLKDRSRRITDASSFFEKWNINNFVYLLLWKFHALDCFQQEDEGIYTFMANKGTIMLRFFFLHEALTSPRGGIKCNFMDMLNFCEKEKRFLQVREINYKANIG